MICYFLRILLIHGINLDTLVWPLSSSYFEEGELRPDAITQELIPANLLRIKSDKLGSSAPNLFVANNLTVNFYIY